MSKARPSRAARLRMQDIAELVGVSAITVSRALRGDASVRADTRERIVEVARQAGYRLNLPARNLRQARSRVVSVVVGASPSEARGAADAFPLELLKAISEELTAAGYSLLLATSQDLEAAPVQSSDGGILLGQGADDSALHRATELPIPWVVWGVHHPGDRHPTVDTDNRRGGELAAERFADLGRRRALFLGDPHHGQVEARRAGFVAAAEREGIEVSTASCDFTYAAGYHAVNELWARGERFDALFACCDQIALGAVSALRERQARVPQDVSVIGYDDTPMSASCVPALSSIHQDWRAGGRRLARKVLDLIEGRAAPSEILPASLTLRET